MQLPGGNAAPVVERVPEEPPPFIVVVQGPPGVGKSLLIKCLVKHYAKQSLGDVRGPITVVAGKQRRLTFVECPQVQILNFTLLRAKLGV